MEIIYPNDSKIIKANEIEEKTIINSVNTNKPFKIDVKFTDYNQHLIEISVKRITGQTNDNRIFFFDKIFKGIYEINEIIEISPYFKKLNSLFEIAKEIKKCIKEGQNELYENKIGVTLIINISSFIDFNYKIPFILLEYDENEKENQNQNQYQNKNKNNNQIQNKNLNQSRNINNNNSNYNNNNSNIMDEELPNKDVPGYNFDQRVEIPNSENKMVGNKRNRMGSLNNNPKNKFFKSKNQQKVEDNKTNQEVISLEDDKEICTDVNCSQER